MTGATPHVGDVGTELVIEFLDEDSAVVPITAATEILIFLTPPQVPTGDSATRELTGVLDTDGADGMAKYVTLSDTFDVEGIWEIQGRVTLGAGEWKTEKASFMVGP